jgi:hypothetical protein
MSEIQIRPFQLSLNTSLEFGLQGSRVMPAGGLSLVCEFDERVGLGELINQYLTGSRVKNAQFGFANLLRCVISSIHRIMRTISLPPKCGQTKAAMEIVIKSWKRMKGELCHWHL